MNKTKPIVVKKWINSGVIGKIFSQMTEVNILDICDTIIEDSCSREILGDVLFQATNGEYYTVKVEAVIHKVSKVYAGCVIDRTKINQGA